MAGNPASDGGRDYDDDHEDTPDEAPPQQGNQEERPGGH